MAMNSGPKPSEVTLSKVKPSEVIELAIEKLEKKGWCQGKYDMPDGSICLMESLLVANGELMNVNTASLGLARNNIVTGRAIGDFMIIKQALEAMTDDIPETRSKLVPESSAAVHSMAAWNDAIGRTKDEVLDKLTAAAKFFRNQGA